MNHAVYTQFKFSFDNDRNNGKFYLIGTLGFLLFHNITGDLALVSSKFILQFVN